MRHQMPDGPKIDLFRREVPDDLPALHHQHAVGDPDELLDLLARNKNGGTAFGVPDQDLANLGGRRDVEPPGRIVGDNERWIARRAHDRGRPVAGCRRTGPRTGAPIACVTPNFAATCCRAPVDMIQRQPPPERTHALPPENGILPQAHGRRQAGAEMPRRDECKASASAAGWQGATARMGRSQPADRVHELALPIAGDAEDTTSSPALTSNDALRTAGRPRSSRTDRPSSLSTTSPAMRPTRAVIGIWRSPTMARVRSAVCASSALPDKPPFRRA